jgi:Fic family protein
VKVPVSPPDFESLVNNSGNLRFVDLQYKPLPSEDRYFHYDQLRHRTPPNGWTVDEYWLATKLRRNARSRELPLHDKHGQTASYVQLPQIEAALMRIDKRLAGFLNPIPPHALNTQNKTRFIISSLMEEAISSSIFEGAVSTREVAKELLLSGRHPVNRSEQMIANNYAAMRRIMDMRNDPLSVDAILELHRVLTDRTLDKPDQAGRFQLPGEKRVMVVDHRINRILHEPPAAGTLPKRMQALCDFANARDDDKNFLHPVLRAITLHFWIGYDHPFFDGNGRTARALFYWSMLHHDYRLAEFLVISQFLIAKQAAYVEAYLYVETDGFDLTYFYLHQLDIIENAIASLTDYVIRKQSDVDQVTDLMRSRNDLNHRQRALLAHALKRPDTRYTIVQHQNAHGIVYATARDDLRELLRLNLLEERKSGRTLVYTAAKNLPSKLKKI